jgi:hypothetical protein
VKQRKHCGGRKILHVVNGGGHTTRQSRMKQRLPFSRSAVLSMEARHRRSSIRDPNSHEILRDCLEVSIGCSSRVLRLTPARHTTSLDRITITRSTETVFYQPEEPPTVKPSRPHGGFTSRPNSHCFPSTSNSHLSSAAWHIALSQSQFLPTATSPHAFPVPQASDDCLRRSRADGRQERGSSCAMRVDQFTALDQLQ